MSSLSISACKAITLLLAAKLAVTISVTLLNSFLGA